MGTLSGVLHATPNLQMLRWVSIAGGWGKSRPGESVVDLDEILQALSPVRHTPRDLIIAEDRDLTWVNDHREPVSGFWVVPGT